MSRVKRKIAGVMIAGVKSGSGKTTLTCALLEALKQRGFNPCAFKCGPDYIDPMFHRKVIDVPSHNLDSFFSEKEQLYNIYIENEGIAVVEGAMGLFDGLGGIREEGSAYHVASILQLRILLVVDAHGMGRSILPLLAGFLKYDKEKRIAGVILNKISESFYKSMAPMIEKEIGISVLGFLPKQQEFLLESRHLGLKLPEEIPNLQKKVQYMAEVLEGKVSVDKIIEIANSQMEKNLWEKNFKLGYTVLNSKKNLVKIGVARDEAFCFYYEENLKLLEQNGAELVFFSPLHDRELPKDLDAILLGGGYPEVYAKDLEQNCSMRISIRQAIESGMPSVAECGGFMYLHNSIEDDKGNLFYMCGVLPGKCFYTGKLVRFGYIELKEKSENFLKKNTSIKGHEFHYYDSEDNGQDCMAKKPITENRWDCVYDKGNYFWGFPHLYYPSNFKFVLTLIEKAEFYQKKRGVDYKNSNVF